jgi:anti-anti-sigma factor
MALDVHIRRRGGVVVVDLAGRLVVGHPVERLRDVIRRLLADGSRMFVINLSNIADMDTCGLSAILSTHVSVKREHGLIALLSPSRPTLVLLHIAKLTTVFDVYESETKAIDALTTKARLAARTGFLSGGSFCRTSRGLAEFSTD